MKHYQTLLIINYYLLSSFLDVALSVIIINYQLLFTFIFIYFLDEALLDITKYQPLFTFMFIFLFDDVLSSTIIIDKYLFCALFFIL